MQTLWRDYRRTRDQHLRDRLILNYAPLVKYVAGRLGSGLPAHVDEGDLVSYGLLGLIGAIERFDPDRDIKFETYAISRIKGSIIDELRAMDWVPRSVRARARDIERAIAELEAKLGRAPTDDEIAGKVGVSTDELADSLTDISRSSIADARRQPGSASPPPARSTASARAAVSVGGVASPSSNCGLTSAIRSALRSSRMRRASCGTAAASETYETSTVTTPTSSG